MKFHVLTFFPELYGAAPGGALAHGLMARAQFDGHVEITSRGFRDFSLNTYGQVDDSPYGGGSGMVLRPEPAFAAIRDAKEKLPNAKVVLLSPRGKPLTQQLCHELSGTDQILICCRYEGIDQRVIDEAVDLEVSLGDFILMGGDVAAMALMEATTRLLPGVLGNPESIVTESFGNGSFEQGLLEHPQYTKPQEFEGHAVPATLLSGNHAEIERWRHAAAVQTTRTHRPDLLDKALERPLCDVSICLMHYPVFDKRGETIASSVTNLDLHDISRSSKTYGLNRYYVIHPTKALRGLVEKICRHWNVGHGKEYNANRSEALEMLRIFGNLDDAILDIEQRTGQLPVIISTDARPNEETIGYRDLRLMMKTTTRPHLIMLGTAWGLGDELLDRADFRLAPLWGPTDYNHLSVRSAAAIMLDRLFGKA